MLLSVLLYILLVLAVLLLRPGLTIGSLLIGVGTLFLP